MTYIPMATSISVRTAIPEGPLLKNGFRPRSTPHRDVPIGALVAAQQDASRIVEVLPINMTPNSPTSG